MGLQNVFRIQFVALFLLLMPMCASAQDMNRLKSAVVRIRNTRDGEVGTGFIVKVDKNLIYIVTASHVVKGSENPEVFLYNRQQEALSAKLRYREDENLKGLALLTLKSNDAKTFSDLVAASFGDSSQLNGGELVKIIGFPDGTSFWTVSSGTISRVEGNYLIFSGPIRGGNSGGPVILNDGQVIGMVTDTIESQEISSATKAETIVSFINGLVPKPTTTNKPAEKRQDDDASGDEFCRVLNRLLDAGENGFYSIVGEPTGSEKTFSPNILLPGARYGYVNPKERVYYSLLDRIPDKGEVEKQFYATVTKVKACVPNWEEKEDADSAYRYHKFRRGNGTSVVRVYYNVIAQGANQFFLTLSIDLPGQGRW
jgi:V8-like Glu-specific endopeptidase